MASSSSSDPLIAFVIGLLAGIGLFAYGFLSLRRKRLIENTPTSKARSVAMGPVEVFGHVEPFQGKVLKAPFSRGDCVYYKYAIEERRTRTDSRGRTTTYWATVKDGSERTHFLLRDETGAVLVGPEGADMDIPEDFEFQSGLGRDPPEAVKQFLTSQGLGFEGFLGINKTMRYSEHHLAVGDKVFVFGTAGDNPLVKEGTALQGSADVMIQKGSGAPFYITDKSEKEVLGALRWKSLGGIYGGAALLLACLYGTVKYLGFI